MLSLPNLLSFLRLPLAIFFIKKNIVSRLVIIILAMATDYFDGFFARRLRQETFFGTLLDPLMDRVFVSFLLVLFILEKSITLPQAIILLSREIAVVIFGCYLIFKNHLTSYRFRAIWIGKITTFFQFIVLLSITLGKPLSNMWLIPFVLLGILALIELYTSRKEQIN